MGWETAVAEVMSSCDSTATVRWILNPLREGAFLYKAAPAVPAVPPLDFIGMTPEKAAHLQRVRRDAAVSTLENMEAAAVRALKLHAQLHADAPPPSLPALPEPTLTNHEHELWGQNVVSDFYTAEQMQAYARLCLDKQRETA